MAEFGVKAKAAKAWFKSKLSTGSEEDPYANCVGIIDVKTPQKVSKYAKKLLDFTSNKRLNLKNSPPYLQGILIDTQELIIQIFRTEQLDMLKTNTYLSIFVTKFYLHSKKTLKLFKDAKEGMENEQSPYRRELNKYTLVFSHMLAELKTMFKEGRYVPEFKIVKREAREFWEQSFGKTVTVSWKEFAAAFTKVHKFWSYEESMAFKKTMDLLENNHISWFEFDIFTRLFQPWKQLLNNWNVIVVTHPGYQAFMTYDEVDGVLLEWKHKPGSYVFRLSCTRLGQWAIGFVTPQHTIVQTIPQSKSLYQALIDGAEDKTYIFPCGQDYNPDIRKQIRVAPEQHIKVTKEQYDLYCDIDTTFELCKICNSNLKSCRIDPCGHLLCRDCLTHWIEVNPQKKGDAECPFCREKVLSTESIVVDPFDPFGDDDDDDDAGPGMAVGPPMTSFRRDLQGASPNLQRRESWAASGQGASGAGSALAAKHAAASKAKAVAAQRQAPERPPPRGTPDRPPALPQRPDRRSADDLPPRSRRSSSQSGPPPPEESIQTLVAMGFERNQVIKALGVAKGDVALATEILCNFTA